MNFPATLKNRLSKLEHGHGASQKQWRDFSHLRGWELDRLKEIGRLGLDDTPEGEKRKKEFVFLVGKCPLVTGTTAPRIRPPFRRPLISYWHRVLSQDPTLPRGWVSLHQLTFQAKDYIVQLSQAYGWDPKTGSTEAIEPLDDWHPDDRNTLLKALYGEM